jgi:N utilization substance protein B
MSDMNDMNDIAPQKTARRRRSTKRRRARELALQGLYQWRTGGVDAATVESNMPGWAAYAADVEHSADAQEEAVAIEQVDSKLYLTLVRGVIREHALLTAQLTEALDRPFDELSPIEAVILLMATFEFARCPATPYRVIINETIELAKVFIGEDELYDMDDMPNKMDPLEDSGVLQEKTYCYMDDVLNKIATKFRATEVSMFVSCAEFLVPMSDEKSARRWARGLALQSLYYWRIGSADIATIETYLPEFMHWEYDEGNSVEVPPLIQEDYKRNQAEKTDDLAEVSPPIQKDYRETESLLCLALVRGVIAEHAALVERMSKVLDRPFAELSQIESLVLLMATYELLHRLETPYLVIINEAIELAKVFGSEDGYRYINGVLDKIAAESRASEVHAARVKKKNKTRKTAWANSTS